METGQISGSSIVARMLLGSEEGCTMTRTGKVLLSGLLFAAVGAFTAQAAESDAAVYRPTQGLNHRFGSKLAVGYFLQKDGACALSIFLTENADEGTAPPSASRLQVKVAPGEDIKLNSVEGKSLEFKCGAGAATLEVKGGTVQNQYASR